MIWVIIYIWGVRHTDIKRSSDYAFSLKKEGIVQFTVSLHANVYLADKEMKGGPCGRNSPEENADNLEEIRTANYTNASLKRFPYTNQLGQCLAYFVFLGQKLLFTIFHIGGTW
jgi:hypothetical protein